MFEPEGLGEWGSFLLNGYCLSNGEDGPGDLKCVGGGGRYGGNPDLLFVLKGDDCWSWIIGSAFCYTKTFCFWVLFTIKKVTTSEYDISQG